jgi:hypothetical protein
MPARLTTLVLAILIPVGATIPAVREMQGHDAAAPRATSGIRAYIDPASGKLTQGAPIGTPQRELPIPALEPDDSKLEILHRANGSIQVRFHGQRQATVYATLADDGTVQTHCVESTAELNPELRPDEQP